VKHSLSWAADEFRDLDLGDKRREARAVLLAERLADKAYVEPAGACSGCAETQGQGRGAAAPERAPGRGGARRGLPRAGQLHPGGTSPRRPAGARPPRLSASESTR